MAPSRPGAALIDLPALPRRPLVVAATSVALLAAPAVASAAWGEPQELDTSVGVAGLAVDGAGSRLVNGRVSGSGNAINTRFLAVAADGSPGGRRNLRGALPDPVRYGDSRAVFGRMNRLGAVTRRVPDGKGGTRSVKLTKYRIGVSTGTTDPDQLAIGALRSVGAAVLDEPVRLAGTAKGDVVLAWSAVGSDGTVSVYAAWHRARAKDRTIRLGKPRRISGTPSSRLLALATGPGGRTVLVFERGATEKTRRLYVRPLDVRSGKLGRLQVLRRGGPGFTDASAAVGNKGRAVIAWGEQDDASARKEPYVVRSATRDDEDERFKTRIIDRGGALVRAPNGTIVTSVDNRRRPLVAWSQTVGSVADGTAHDIPRVAEGGPTGRLGDARDIAAAGRVHGASTAKGTTGVILVRELERPAGGSNSDRGVAVQAAFRAPDGALGEPETLDQLDDAQLLERRSTFGSAAIAALPDGRFTAAWVRATVVSGKLRQATLFADRTKP
ncbi:MAG: hypothetical protein M0P31_04105 [Solirubrobacteraceae bacterium]|nr:hypothetical protein [Solirubrobacteraceae bacterium]